MKVVLPGGIDFYNNCQNTMEVHNAGCGSRVCFDGIKVHPGEHIRNEMLLTESALSRDVLTGMSGNRFSD